MADERGVAQYFEAVVGAGADARVACNWMTGEVFRLLKESGTDIEDSPVSAGALAELIALVADGTVNQTAAKEVLGVLWDKGGSPGAIVEERGLKQISDTSELDAAVAQVIADNPDPVAKVKGGDQKPIQFLMGQVMRATKGNANPQLVQQLLKDQLAAT